MEYMCRLGKKEVEDDEKLINTFKTLKKILAGSLIKSKNNFCIIMYLFTGDSCKGGLSDGKKKSGNDSGRG